MKEWLSQLLGFAQVVACLMVISLLMGIVASGQMPPVAPGLRSVGVARVVATSLAQAGHGCELHLQFRFVSASGSMAAGSGRDYTVSGKPIRGRCGARGLPVRLQGVMHPGAELPMVVRDRPCQPACDTPYALIQDRPGARAQARRSAARGLTARAAGLLLGPASVCARVPVWWLELLFSA